MGKEAAQVEQEVHITLNTAMPQSILLSTKPGFLWKFHNTGISQGSYHPSILVVYEEASPLKYCREFNVYPIVKLFHKKIL